MSRRKGDYRGEHERWARPTRPLPVSRALHWRLDCACGKVLSTCICCPDGQGVHVEVWAEGCDWVAKHYPAAPARQPVTPKTPGQLAFVAARDAQARSTHPLRDQEATIVALLRSGYSQHAIATRYGVSDAVVHLVLKRLGLTRRYRKWELGTTQQLSNS